jgi:DNA-binding Lrp family transcriptional regulator
MTDFKLRLDATDRKLIALLRRDARRSNVSLAQEIGISDVAIQKRLQRLLERRIIHTTLFVDYRRIGLTQAAIFCVKLAVDKRDAVFESLSKFPTAMRVTRTNGLYNLILSVSFSTAEEMSAFLLNYYPTISGIESSEILFLIQTSTGRHYDKPVGLLDVKDEAIVRVLQEDSRQSAADIARRLGIPLSTARRRLSHLTDSGIILPLVLVKPNFLTFTEGDVFFRVERDKLPAVWDYLRHHPAVVDYAALTLGYYNIATYVWGDSQEAIVQLINNDFRQLDGVTECQFFPNEGSLLGQWQKNRTANLTLASANLHRTWKRQRRTGRNRIPYHPAT